MSDAAPEKQPERPRSAAGTVAAGIFASRIVGFVREAVVAFFLGVGAHTDVFQAAFRAPNLLQNLLGEGTISAAFIPVYRRMIQEGPDAASGRFAGASASTLLLVGSLLVLPGLLLARAGVSMPVAGYVGAA